MSISHALGYFLPEYASKDRSSVTYVTSPTTGEVSIRPSAKEGLGFDRNRDGLEYPRKEMYDEVHSNYNANRKYYLLLAGAGAGIAANFNAPLTGAMYSMEITKMLFLSQKSNQPVRTSIHKDAASSSVAKAPAGMGSGSLSPGVATPGAKEEGGDEVAEDMGVIFNENDYRYLNINRGKSSALLLAVSAAGNYKMTLIQIFFQSYLNISASGEGRTHDWLEENIGQQYQCPAHSLVYCRDTSFLRLGGYWRSTL